MSESIHNDITSLNKKISVNWLWGAALILISLLLATALTILVLRGFEQFDELTGVSPRYHLKQAKLGIAAMRENAEAQSNKLRESNTPNPLDAMRNELKSTNQSLSKEEADWSIAIDVYSKVVNRLTNHLGNIKEWQHFYDKKLATLIRHSEERRQQMPANQP